MRHSTFTLFFALFFFSSWSVSQTFGQCTNDTWAPVITYPSQDISTTLDPCDPTPATVTFEVVVTDDCDGAHAPAVPGGPVVPGSEYTVAAIPASGVTLTFLGSNTFSGVFPPGLYQILISAEDAAGNTRDEDFLVAVNQDTPPPTSLSCNPSINATLDENCQRFITADMVLEGDFGCADESDFLVNITNDNDPSNGNILDGCGQFTYEVSYIGSRPLPTWQDCEGFINGRVGGSGNSINLSSQAEVDAFSNPSCLCPVLAGNLVISGPDITDLSNLSGITSVGGNLVIANNSALTSLAGLNGLTVVGGNLYIGGNPVLANLTGLNALTVVGGALQAESNAGLMSLDGLDGLSFAGSLNITDNPLLSTCAVQAICDYLVARPNIATISGNAPGCATRQEVEAACDASGCPTGDINFTMQAEIDAFTTNYPGCADIPGHVTISGADITNLNGLSAINSIGGALTISGNGALTGLSGLEGLASCGALLIEHNPSLMNLDGFNHPVSITGDLSIQNNVQLTGCAVQAVCAYLGAPSGNVTISSNGPSCSSPAEVSSACAGGCSSPLPVTISGDNCFSLRTTWLSVDRNYGYGYTYSWSNSETGPYINVPPGAYCVTVTETATGCMGTDCISICREPTLAISPIRSAKICSGACITLKAMAGNDASYQWSGSGPASANWTVCPTATTTYAVTATNDSGCTDTESVTIYTSPCPNESGCSDILLRPNSGSETGAVESNWAEAVENVRDTEWEATASSGGYGLVQVYPNPASHELVLEYAGQLDKVESLALYNLDGKKVLDVEVHRTGFTRLNISMLPPGVYTLNVNGATARRVVVAR